ncbi:MAG: hypothetical protein GWO85_00790 [Simkaniaceae bacterium]|nr:hypothetical protein [Simkaniaceae bacterium]
MDNQIYRSHKVPIRDNLSWVERWEGQDKGLITCWEVGRELSENNPDLAVRVKSGELPPLGWRGGVEKKTEAKKYGCLNYLAKWQGLRGEDLNIDLEKECELTCSKTGMKVNFPGKPLNDVKSELLF